MSTAPDATAKPTPNASPDPSPDPSPGASPGPSLAAERDPVSGTAAKPAKRTRGRGATATAVSVDPHILSVIKRAEAPAGIYPHVMPPASLPGEHGLLASVRGLVGWLRHGTAYPAAARERYGDIFRFPFVGLPMVCVYDADEILKILRNDERVWSSGMGWDALMFEGIDPRGGNVGTLSALDFDAHLAARKLVQPAFTLRAIEGYLAIARRGFDRAIPTWITRGRIPFKAEVRTLLARVASEIFTGIKDPAKVGVVDRALSDFWYGMMAASRNPWLSPTLRRSRRGLQILLDTFLSLVPERRARGGDDLFSQMCQVKENEMEGLGDEELVRVFLNVMFGAFDTTSLALTSMAYLLAKHPAWQERVREEAATIPAGELDASKMKNLRQLEWVWKETLRLQPVVSFVPRRALREVDVAGHKLPAGTFVAPMMMAIGRHPKWWTEPLKFDPERFSPERAEDRRHPGIYNPFGVGVHACIGLQLANMEMKLFWHMLLPRARFTLAPDYEARHTHVPLGCVSGDVHLAFDPISARA